MQLRYPDMHRLFALALLVLAGCPPPPRYAVVDVYDPEPVQDALVAADCGQYRGTAIRTDETGRARVPIYGEVEPGRCVLTVAKPGYPTVETDSVQMCTSGNACPPTIVQLFAVYGVPIPAVYSRDYAQPPQRRVR